MPAIHVIFDPNDRINTPPDDLKRIGASAAIMSITSVEIETETIHETAVALAALLLNAIARDQQ